MSFGLRLSMSHFIMKKIQSECSEEMDIRAWLLWLFQFVYTVLLRSAETQENLQLNWPIMTRFCFWSWQYHYKDDDRETRASLGEDAEAYACGDGLLSLWPASLRMGADWPQSSSVCSRGAIFPAMKMCTYSERLPASGRWPFIGLVYQPANSSSEWTPLIRTKITRLSFPSLLSVPGQAWLIGNTCKQNTRQHSSI